MAESARIQMSFARFSSFDLFFADAALLEITDPVSCLLHVSAYIYIKIREAETGSSTLNRLEFLVFLYVVFNSNLTDSN